MRPFLQPRKLQRLAGAAFASALLASALVSTPPAVAGDDSAMPVTAAAAPADTAMFFAVDLDHESAQSQLAQELLDRLGLGASWDDWHSSVIGMMPSDRSISEADLEALLGGEAALAVSPAMIERGVAGIEAAGLDRATPIAELEEDAVKAAFQDAFSDGLGIVAILQPGDPDGAWRYVERQMASAASKSGGTVTTEVYNGVDILTAPDSRFYGMESGSGDSAFGPGEIVTARVGDLILTATSAIDLEPAIDAASGGASLASSPAMDAVRSELPSEALAFMFANAKPIMTALGPKWTDLVVAQYDGTLTAEEVRTAFDTVSGMAVWADTPGFRIDAIELRPNGEPLPSVLGEIVPSTFAEEVPAGTMLYAAGSLPRMTLDQMAYSTALSILSANDAYVTPETLEDTISLYTPDELARRVAEAERYIGFNLKTDFTDNLDGSFGMAFGLPSISMTGVGVDAIWTMGATNPAAIASDLVKVARLAERSGDVDIQASKIGTDSFYAVRPSEGDEGVPGVGFGVLGDRLVAGTESGVAAWRNGTDGPLSGDSQFQQIMGLLPTEPWMSAYIDFRQVAPLIMQLSEMEGAPPASLDADPACAAHVDANAAQQAFEQEPLANSGLDADFDGIACEDFFIGAGATPEPAAGSLVNLRAFGMTAWNTDGRYGWSMLLHIAEPGS
jgi:hypothetical protein